MSKLVSEPRSEGVGDAPTGPDEAVADAVAVEETAPDDTAAEDAAAATSAEPVAEEAVAEDAASEPAAETVPEEAPPPVVASPEPRVVRRRSPLRRAAAVSALALVAALAVSAFAIGGAGDADQHFVDTARSQGVTVDAGEQEQLLVSAAHKICERRENHSTAAERRASALSIAELGAVTDTFPGDAQAFTSLALSTYCSA